jgi:hypothetical protein
MFNFLLQRSKWGCTNIQFLEYGDKSFTMGFSHHLFSFSASRHINNFEAPNSRH